MKEIEDFETKYPGFREYRLELDAQIKAEILSRRNIKKVVDEQGNEWIWDCTNVPELAEHL